MRNYVQSAVVALKFWAAIYTFLRKLTCIDEYKLVFILFLQKQINNNFIINVHVVSILE